MITAQEARDKVEQVNIQECIMYLSSCITKAAEDGKRSIDLHSRPYNMIGSPDANDEIKRVCDLLVENGFIIEHNSASTQLDNDKVRISW